MSAFVAGGAPPMSSSRRRRRAGEVAVAVAISAAGAWLPRAKCFRDGIDMVAVAMTVAGSR